MADEKGLVPVSSSIVMPAVSPEQAIKAWNMYQELKKKIITPDDEQSIAGKVFLKKSYWRKISRFFNLSVEIMQEKTEQSSDGVTTYFVTARATAPNGAFQDGDGSCSTDEKGLPKTPHNARAIAVTRAKNRAISDLVGGGEVSAEEIIADENHSKNEKEEDQQPAIISEKQKGRFFAIYRSKGYTDKQAKGWLIVQYGIESSKDITKDVYEQLCEDFQQERVPKNEK